MDIEGHCHCEQIQYRATVDEEAVVICHCTDCQQLSGSAFRTVAFTRPGAFEITAGTIKTYVKIAESGNRREQGFCGNCGSAIYATSTEDGPKVYGLRVGTIKQRESLLPKRQVWHRSALGWVDHIGELPAIDGQR